MAIQDKSDILVNHRRHCNLLAGHGMQL
jgi:hypothetical protein